MDKKAEAYKKSEFARLEMVLEMQKTVLPQVAENVAKPMGQIGDVTIYGQTGGEVAGISQNVPVVMQRTFDIVKDVTGVDLADVMKSETIDAKVKKEVSISGIE
jgi:flotillin